MNTTKQHILSLTLVICLALACLAGCGAQGGTQGSTAQSGSDAPASSSTGNVAVYGGPWQVARYGTATTATLYEKADTGAAVLASFSFANPAAARTLYVLKEENGWALCVYQTMLGWVEAASLTMDESQGMDLPLPEFMTEAQQLSYLYATGLFDAYLAHNRGFDVDYEDVQEVPYPGKDFNLTYAHDAAWGTYADFDTAMHSLFTAALLAERTAEEPITYKDINGRVYIVQADRGTWYCPVESYTLTEQTDTRLVFDVNFLYKTSVAEHRCSLPVEMVQENGVWKFNQFTGGSDDIRWMAAMGEDFDPWEGM